MVVLPEKPQVHRFFAFNTVNCITAWTADAAAVDEVVALHAGFEKLFSRTLPTSELARVNDAQGKPVEVSLELASLIADALTYCQATEGLYDITMGAVVRLWHNQEQRIPTAAELDVALQHVDYRRVRVDGQTVQLEDPLASIDLGGIAKGYIADRFIQALAERGIESAMVNLGGNVAVLGSKPNGSPWRIGLRSPVSSEQQTEEQSFAVVEVRDASVTTSGVYERALLLEGQRFHHILNPETGYPAQTDLLGASLITQRSLDGDGYSTALILMGLDAAFRFVEDKPELQAVFVTTTGDVYTSSGVGKEIPFALLR